MISIKAYSDEVIATYEASGTEVSATGNSLTEAVENLVVRFAELQQKALEELRDRGFIRVEKREVTS